MATNKVWFVAVTFVIQLFFYSCFRRNKGAYTNSDSVMYAVSTMPLLSKDDSRDPIIADLLHQSVGYYLQEPPIISLNYLGVFFKTSGVVRLPFYFDGTN